jgi:hypothetical protein
LHGVFDRQEFEDVISQVIGVAPEPEIEAVVGLETEIEEVRCRG